MTDEEKFVLHDPELFVGDNALARRGEPLHVWGENTSATGLTEATGMSDEELVKALRDAVNGEHDMTPHGADCLQAADRIEQLVATNEELCVLHREYEKLLTERIEELQQALKDQSSVSDRLAEANEKMKEKFLVVMAERDEAWERAEHAEEQWGRCGVKLAKALAGLDKAAALIEDRHVVHMTSKGRDPKDYISEWSLIAKEVRALLAEIEGAKL
jgi:hypothetical protein